MTVGNVSSLSNLASAASASSSNSNASQLSATNLTFTSYLKIMTTQLKNQDPTNATDPNQYTAELIQLEQVQSQITTNSDLENLTKATAANGLATGVTYIGNYVRAPTSSGEFALQGGSAEIGYTLAGAAKSTTITIQDSSGSTVATLSGGGASGDNYVTWNGTNSSGKTLDDGAYTFTVAATDSSGKTVKSSNPTALFKVTAVQSNSNGTLQLDAGALSLSSTDVTGVYTSTTRPAATTGTVTG